MIIICGEEAPDSAGLPFRASPVSFSLAVFLLPWFHHTVKESDNEPMDRI